MDGLAATRQNSMPVSHTRGVVRTVLADDHGAFRDLFRINLQRMGGYEIVGETGDGAEVYDVVSRLRPDLLVLDYFLPGVSGLELIQKLTDNLPEVRVLVLTGCQQKAIIDEIIRTPVAGYVAKAGSIQMVNLALMTIAAGGTFRGQLPPAAYDGIPANELTPREQEILRLIANGLSTKEISSEIGLSVKTVDHHRTRMMRKLNIHDVVTLTRYALRSGIATLD